MEDLILESPQVLETLETVVDYTLSFEEINQLMYIQLNNQVEMFKIILVIFGVIFASIVSILFIRSVFNNAG